MRKLSVIILISVLIFGCSENPKEECQTKAADSLNVEKNINVSGTYKGFLPCADCPGTLTTLKLNDDKTFEKSDFYLEAKNGFFSDKGTFSFNTDKDNNIITLKSSKDTFMLAFQEHSLIMLDKNGKKAGAELANMYELTKLSDATCDFNDKPIKGFLTFGHEVSCFEPCGSSKAYWLNDLSGGELNKRYKEITKNASVAYTPVMAELILQKGNPASTGFAEQYDGVVNLVEIKWVKAISPETYCKSK